MPAETTAARLRESTDGSLFTAKDAAAVLDIPVHITAVRLSQLASMGLLERVERGRYVAAASDSDFSKNVKSGPQTSETTASRLREATCETAEQDELLGDAIFQVLTHTGMDALELLPLKLAQYKSTHLINVCRNGKKVRRKLSLAKPARDALHRYVKLRGKAAGFLFQSPRGGRLTRRTLEEALNKIGLSICASWAY